MFPWSGVSVSMSVDSPAPCKSRCRDRDPVLGGLLGSKEHCIRWESQLPTPSRIWCGLRYITLAICCVCRRCRCLFFSIKYRLVTFLEPDWGTAAFSTSPFVYFCWRPKVSCGKSFTYWLDISYVDSGWLWHPTVAARSSVTIDRDCTQCVNEWVSV